MTGRGTGGWSGGKPFKHLSTVLRESAAGNAREATQADYDRVSAERRGQEYYEPETLHDWEQACTVEGVLEIWQHRVGFVLGDVRRRAFLRRPEVGRLALFPAGVLEDAAAEAMELSSEDHLLLEEWYPRARARMQVPRHAPS